MRVNFEWCSPAGQGVPEGEIDGRLAEIRSLLKEQGWELGTLLLEGDGGQPLVRITDDLSRLIEQLCYEAPPLLHAGKAYVFEFSDSPAEVQFHPNGEVVVTGASPQPAPFPKAKLLPALVACGERYNRFQSRMADGNTTWLEYVATLDRMAAATRAALAGGPAS